MNQSEWENALHPRLLLDKLPHPRSNRKLRLFAVACCRFISVVFEQSACPRGIEVAERFADGHANDGELALARLLINFRNPIEEFPEKVQQELTANHPELVDELKLDVADNAAAYATDPDAMIAAKQVGRITLKGWAHFNSGDEPHVHAEILEWGMPREVQRDLLLDIFGNPFRPVTFDPSWRTPNATAVAQTIYDERRFEDMPILADALEEAGCANDEILNHCRSGNVHVRGCWVVDLILGKE